MSLALSSFYTIFQLQALPFWFQVQHWHWLSSEYFDILLSQITWDCPFILQVIIKTMIFFPSSTQKKTTSNDDLALNITLTRSSLRNTHRKLSFIIGVSHGHLFFVSEIYQILLKLCLKWEWGVADATQPSFWEENCSLSWEHWDEDHTENFQINPVSEFNLTHCRNQSN